MKVYVTVESRLKDSEESWGMVIAYPIDTKSFSEAFDAAVDYIAVNRPIFKNIEYRIGESTF